MSHRVITLPGDGIGHEIMPPTIKLLKAVTDDLEFEEYLFGGASIDEHDVPLTDETLKACKGAAAVLLACVGGPKWDSTDSSKPRPEEGLLALRQGLGLYGNLRPVRPLPALYAASPLREKQLRGTDLLIVRELTGGIYFGERGQIGDTTYDRCEYSDQEVQRIARVAFKTGGGKVTLVEYPNVPDTPERLATSEVWNQVVDDLHDAEFPHVELEHMSIKKAVQQMGYAPSEFDTILTENMLGDILSDQAAVLVGSLGMLPSISVGGEGSPTLSEPAHGSAPGIAGQGIANPFAMFKSAALMLRHGLGKEEEATALETAVEQAVADGLRTSDLGGDAGTKEATKAVLDNL